MADTKITALTAIGANPIIPSTFPIPMVDLTDTSMAASGTTKKVTVNQILQAGGTATLASATITGDLTVDTSTLKVDSANDRVGIGTTSPDATLDVTSAGTASTYTVSAVIQDGTYPASGNPTLEFNGFIGGNGYRSGIGSIGGQQLAFYTPSTFGVAPTERVRIDAAGNCGIGVTPAGTGGCLQLKSGITFPATQVASSDANTLDDYEEGTWTATLKGSVSDPTTPVTATGRYTKIGRVVTVQVAIENVDTTGASGEISITGLPFTNGSSRTLGTAGSISGATFTEMMVSELTSGSATITFQSIISNAAWTPATHNVGSFRYFWANVTYTV